MKSKSKYLHKSYQDFTKACLR